MRAVNLHLLTRTHEPQMVSLLLKALSGRPGQKMISDHEAATLWSLTDRIAAYFREEHKNPADGWLSLLDGFYFSYVIEHIGKEFDLLKISADGGSILNIELKSEQVEEEKIRKQLEQNRYYLSHIAHTIDSFTYVMETDRLYTIDKKGGLMQCGTGSLARVLMKKELRDYLPEGIEKRFRTAEYLISPIDSPDKFLQGKYFLTNQQFDFRRRILDALQELPDNDEKDCVISISGIAGTGKTLLLLDLAKQLTETKRIMLIHSGPLRKGHYEIGRQMKNIRILSGKREFPDDCIRECDCLMIDEADRLDKDVFDRLVSIARRGHIPVILTYDPHQLLLAEGKDITCREVTSEAAERIASSSSMTLAFTGNIRINRPVYSFLRTLLHLKERPVVTDYSCIDVLYANDEEEQKLMEEYFRKKGYVLVSMSEGAEKEDDVIAREYEKVLMVLDDTYYYDESLHLRVRVREEEALRLLYEGLSRTRENLCLVITGSPDLFLRVLAVRLN